MKIHYKYSLHHVTYAPAKFEVAMSNGLGVDAFTRKYKFDLGLRRRCIYNKRDGWTNLKEVHFGLHTGLPM